MPAPEIPSRRDFLTAATAGAGLLALAGCTTKNPEQLPEIAAQARKSHARPRRNMCGHGAEKIDTVRIGVIGIGRRGAGSARRLSRIEGAKVIAVSDHLPERAKKAQARLPKIDDKPVDIHTGSEQAWEAMCERDDIDLIYICTPWRWHATMALHAMTHGKHVAVEVPAAVTIDECWQLVETSEQTGRHCMMLENCCYSSFELMTLNMIRKGYLGDVIHAEGAYIHDLRGLMTTNHYQGYWRLIQNAKRNGNLYPTHGLGPIAQCMDINRGDKFEYLSSLSSADHNFKPLVGKTFGAESPHSAEIYGGNMNVTMIRTTKGRSIMLQHDVTTPRPYSRIHLISGTKGTVQRWPKQVIANGHRAMNDEQMKEVVKQYAHPLLAEARAANGKLTGHGGMDSVMDWRLIHCLRHGLPLDQDVYDAAAWSAVAPLSEWSVANRSNSIDVPDFTRGHWTGNKPLEFTS